MVNETVVPADVAKLIALIRQMEAEGFSWSARDGQRPSKESADAVVALLKALPMTTLPKVAPDGEGGMMLMWGTRDNGLLVIVDGWTIRILPMESSHDA